jgi:ABC-type uncharacterized transport system ATPase subunit
VVLAVEGLTLDTHTPRGWKRLLRDVSFELRRGEILGMKFLGIDGLPDEGVTWVNKGQLTATFL